jgi:hypothetical protein
MEVQEEEKEKVQREKKRSEEKKKKKKICLNTPLWKSPTQTEPTIIIPLRSFWNRIYCSITKTGAATNTYILHY